jgi:peptidyl-prolyl cis-trans isomerase C
MSPLTVTVSPALSRAPHRQHRAPGLLAAVAFAILLAAPASAAPPNKETVVARVNGVDIRQGDLDIAEADLGAGVPGSTSAEKHDALIGIYADMILAARNAEQKGMGSTVEFARKLAFAKTKLLMEALMDQAAKDAVTDKALHEVYDQAIKQMGNVEEVHAHHILVKTEAEAKEILAELKKGADFEKLAKEKSKDPGAASGGDLGYFTKEQMVPEFAAVAFKLNKGELSEPVKTQFGWHIIRVDDKRIKPAPEFDKVKPQLVQYLERKAQGELIAKLREGAKIERLDAASSGGPAKP